MYPPNLKVFVGMLSCAVRVINVRHIEHRVINTFKLSKLRLNKNLPERYPGGIYQLMQLFIQYLYDLYSLSVQPDYLGIQDLKISDSGILQSIIVKCRLGSH